VHNLRRIDWARGDNGFDWAERFDVHVREVMTTRPASLSDVQRHPDYSMAVPTPEHCLPLAYLADLCSADGAPTTPFAQGCTLGSLSMTSYLVGMAPPVAHTVGTYNANAMPANTPPEQTNI
jgi:4,5-DOPA dioxygenase extradiol